MACPRGSAHLCAARRGGPDRPDAGRGSRGGGGGAGRRHHDHERRPADRGGVPRDRLAEPPTAPFAPSITLPAILAPLAIDAAPALHTSPLPFAMAIIAATGMGLLTPFSNPVMLMVMAPGGYRMKDYGRSGLPLGLILLLLMLVPLPLAYPF